ILPSVPSKPTKDDAIAALNLLNGLIREFPFVGEVDKAVALSGLITPIVRGMMPVAPLHLFHAPEAGTGKSYLMDIISTICTGRICPAVSAGLEPVEFDKKLTSALLGGYLIVSIDNVNGELGGDLLCQAVERRLVQLRPLGRSEMIEVECQSTIFANG